MEICDTLFYQCEGCGGIELGLWLGQTEEQPFKPACAECGSTLLVSVSRQDVAIRPAAK